jgi:hypothetical protein
VKSELAAHLLLSWTLLAALPGRASAQEPSAGRPEATAAADPEAAADDADAVDDEDPRALVIFNVRLQHVELGDGNSIDLVLLRRDAAIRRPHRPGVRVATLRWDLPVGRAHLGGENFDGLGDLYFQALNFRDLSRRFTLGSGLAFKFPTATEDPLGAGKWQVAPSLFPVRPMPAKRALFFTKIQDFLSVAGDDDRRDIHQLVITPTLVKTFQGRWAVLIDAEAVIDWELHGETSWKSGLLFATRLGEHRAAWAKVEVPWGEHRIGEWTVRVSHAWRL